MVGWARVHVPRSAVNANIMIAKPAETRAGSCNTIASSKMLSPWLDIKCGLN